MRFFRATPSSFFFLTSFKVKIFFTSCLGRSTRYICKVTPKVTCFAQKEHLYGRKRKRNFSKIFFTCGGHPTKLMFCLTFLVLVYPCWCVLTRTHICLPLLKFENRCALVCNWFALAVQMVVLFFISEINFAWSSLKSYSI